MGTPQENPLGYRDSTVMTHIPHMPAHNRLMLIHGLIDENVHFRHTARLINALIGHRRMYDLVLFPCERHAPHKHEGSKYSFEAHESESRSLAYRTSLSY